ncbi:MAG: efflux RND transporter periplasmic adaptor subunit, partial [Acidimicrobiales bacterium]
SDDQTPRTHDQGTLTAAQEKERNDCQGDASAGSGSPSSACSADEAQVASDQQKVDSDQQSVTQAQNALQSAQGSLTSTELKNEQSLQQDESQITTSQSQLTDARANLEIAQTPATASQVYADQAALTADEAALTVAQLNLDQATLVSPIAGTVAAVNILPGQSVSTGSATVSTASSSAASGSGSSSSSNHAVVVESPGTYEVQTTVSDTQIGEVAPGDQAVITSAGSTTDVYGTVTQVGLVATVSSGVATFPVVIGVTGSPPSLYAGSTASVAIVVLQRTNVLTVPASAVHTIGATSFVYELQGAREVEHVVTLGATSGALDQVTSGLIAGQYVVLATLTAQLPTTGPAGRFGRGGLGGGGLGGGGLGRGGLGGG